MRRPSSCWMAVVSLSLACGSTGDGHDSSAGGSGSTGGSGSNGGASGSAGSAGGGGQGSSPGGGGSPGGSGAASLGGAGKGGESGAVSGGGGFGGGNAGCPAPLSQGDVSNLKAQERVDTYAVTGNSAAELRQSIDSNRAGSYDGRTEWNIAWGVANCSSPKWTVTLDISYRLPRWDAPAGADLQLRQEWQRYLDALYCHEYGHGQLALACANSVYDALAALPGSSDCAALSSSGKALFESLLADCQAQEVAYDAQTNHGATMGAVFPP